MTKTAIKPGAQKPSSHHQWKPLSAADEDADHDVLRNGEQPPLDEDEPSRQALGVVDLELRRVVGHLVQREGRIAVGAERAVRVEGHTPRPAQHADVEVEDPPRIAAREEDREERDDGHDDERRPEEEEDDVVRDREQPLDEPLPAAQRAVELPLEPKGYGSGALATSSSVFATATYLVTVPPLQTTVVGSYPQPDWLIDRAKLAGRLPPRVPAGELWRVDEDVARGGEGRRDRARRARHGGGRHRRRHRRRDPA